MIDQVTLQQLADKSQIDQATVLREYLQIEFLHQFYKQATSKKMVFKGGTAIRLLFSGDRFSEDLDFTMLDKNEDVSELVKMALVSLESQGIVMKMKSLKTITGVSLKLLYEYPMMPMPLSIRLDFSGRELVEVAQWGTIKTVLPVSSFVSILHLSMEEILAEKVRAIMNRMKGRDVYDLWYLLSRSVQWNQELIDKKLTYYREKFDAGKLIKKLESWDEKELDQDLRRFLPRGQRELIKNLKVNVLRRAREVV